MSRPELSYRDLPFHNLDLSEDVIQQVEILIKYAGYLEQQDIEVNRLTKLEDKNIPNNFDYLKIHTLRIEARQKLSAIQPQTIGQASRISGVTPADISILLIALRQNGN